MLTASWFDDPLRLTRDLDLLGLFDSDAGEMLAPFREICALLLDGGVVFKVDEIAVEPICEGQASCTAMMASPLASSAQSDSANVPSPARRGLHTRPHPHHPPAGWQLTRISHRLSGVIARM